MRLILFFGVFCFWYSFGNSQNLVDNWSFEDTTHCPTNLTDITASSGWRSYKASPDYFNVCNQNFAGIPENVLGYQFPHSGSSYAGIIVYNANGNSTREVVGRQLNTTLQIGIKYFVSLYVARSVSHNPNFLVDIACNNIGVNFSTIEFGFPIGAWPLNLNSQVYSDSIITDTVSWTKISGSFIADSAYQYIGISNFFPDSLTDRIVYGNNVQSYYFIDDVCVSPDSSFCDQLLNVSDFYQSDAIDIFPNPARDWIEVRERNINSLRFFDVSGRLVKTFSAPFPMTLDISEIDAALYLVAIETKKRVSFQKVFIIH